MNKWITSLFAVALTGSVAFADVAAPAVSAKDLEKVVDEAIYVETNTKGVVLSGYVDAGYMYNFQGGQPLANAGSPESVSKGDFSLNAFKLTLEKGLSDKNEFQAGFRADVKLGEDAATMGGNSNATFGQSDSINVDQAYVIVRAPIGNGLDITAGKFYSLLGYEVDDRPANLNITYGYDFVFVTTQQTGVKLYYPINDILEVQLAVTNGSSLDTNGSGLGLADNSSDGYGVSGTVNIKAPGGNANWFHGIYASNGAADGFTAENEGVLVYNTWGNWAPKFANDKLLLGFSATLGDVNDSVVGADGYTYWTGSLYSKYQFTDVFSLAGRASYLHLSDPVTSFGGAGTAGFTGPNADAFSWTLTAGFNLLENLLVRAEYRIDAYDGSGEIAGEVANTVSAQVVYTF
jgi:hypothetical protein